MKDQISEELLSAYFDGELSAKEHAEVERWLQTSPEARQKLADYRRLSRVFEGFSRAEVPQEFSIEVFHQAERRMLLPDGTPVRRRSRIRVWWVATPVAAAAALLLAFNIANRDPNRHGRNVGGPDHTAHIHQTTVPGGTEVAVRAPHHAAPAAASSTHEATDEDAAESRDLVAAKPSAEGPELATGAAPATEAPELPADAELEVAAVLEDARVGTGETDAKDESLPTVTVYVDGIDGLALVQKVFEDFEIVSGEESKAEIITPEERASKDNGDGPQRKEALCVVVTEPDRLIRAFAAMIRERHPAIRIEAEEPVVLADLDADARQRFADAEREVRRSLERADGAKGDSPGSTRTGSAAGTSGSGLKIGSSESSRKPIAKSGGPSRKTPIGTASRDKKSKKMDRIGEPEVITSAKVKTPDDVAEETESAATEDQLQAVVSRQVRIPVPSGYENRQRSNASQSRRQAVGQRNSRGHAAGRGPAKPADNKPTSDEPTSNADPDAKAAREKPDDEKAPADKASGDKTAVAEKAEKPLVRMLIMVERESQPAGAAPAEKAPEKTSEKTPEKTPEK